jgi:hypothetical protein
MKTSTIYTILYIILLAADGAMSHIYYSYLAAFFIKLLGSIALGISLYFLLKKKEYCLFIILFIVIFLTIFYGYDFYHTMHFFPALMAIISAFFVGSYTMEIISYYGGISRP